MTHTVGLKWIWPLIYFALGVILLICVAERELSNDEKSMTSNHHLFNIINTNRLIQIFQNEKSNFTLNRAGPLLWYKPTNWPQLPVSTPMSCTNKGSAYTYSSFLSAYRPKNDNLNLNLLLKWLRSEYCMPWYLYKRNFEMYCDLWLNQFGMYI